MRPRCGRWVSMRLHKTDTAENTAWAYNEPLSPLVSWKLPHPSRAASTGTRLASDSLSPATRFSTERGVNQS